MTKELLEDLIIEFDEMGYEPTTLCDSEKEIESFRNRLKQVLNYLKSIDNSSPNEANTYLIVSQVRKIVTKIISAGYRSLDSTSEFISNVYIEANSKKEALEKYKKQIQEGNYVLPGENFKQSLDATVLNIIEL